MAESSSPHPRSVRFSSNSHSGGTSGSEMGSLETSHKPLCVAITVRKYLNQRSHSCKASVRSLQLNSERRQVIPTGLLFFVSNVAACSQDGQERSFKLKSKKRARSSSNRPFGVPCDSSASTESDEKPAEVQHSSVASPNAPSDSSSEWNTMESTISPVEQLLPVSPSDAVSDIMNSSFLEDDVVEEKTPTHSAKRSNFLPQKEKSASRVEPKRSAVVRGGKMHQTPPSTQTAPTRSWTSSYCGFGQSFDSRTNWKPTTVMSEEDLAFSANLWANVRRSVSSKQEKEKAEASSQVNKIAGQGNITAYSHDDSTVEKESSASDSPGSNCSRNWCTTAKLSKDLSRMAPFRASPSLREQGGADSAGDSKDLRRMAPFRASPSLREQGGADSAGDSKDLRRMAPFRASPSFRELGGADSDGDSDLEEVGNGCHMSMREFRKTWSDWEKRDLW